MTQETVRGASEPGSPLPSGYRGKPDVAAALTRGQQSAGVPASTTYEPALRQEITARQQRNGVHPRWAQAVYAADGTLLDLILWDLAIGYPNWVNALAPLPGVTVTVAEFESWLRRGAEQQ